MQTQILLNPHVLLMSMIVEIVQMNRNLEDKSD